MPHRGQHHSRGPVLPDASTKIPTGRHDLHVGEQFLLGLDQCLLILHDWSGWAPVWPWWCTWCCGDLGVGVGLHTVPGRAGLGLELGLGVLVGLGWVGDMRVEIWGVGMEQGLEKDSVKYSMKDSLLTSGVSSAFCLSGLFSYLNYMNFWSILGLQAIWS